MSGAAAGTGTGPAESGEFLDIVDENDTVVGRAARSEAHGNPALLHRVVHVLVFDSGGRLFLQKRAEDKDVQPGKWDTSVGGHVDAGEEREEAASRELAEELGVPPSGMAAPELEFLHAYVHSNEYESEFVHTWMCRWDGPFALQESELADGRFWEIGEIEEAGAAARREGGSGPFTPNFLEEMERWRFNGSPLPRGCPSIGDPAGNADPED